jgi:hypothetical protein
MKFPVTRESLQALDSAKYRTELNEEEMQKDFKAMIDRLCQEFQRSMPSNLQHKRFVWRELQNIRQYRRGGSHSEMDTYLPRFIEKLKEVFIGCDIIMDPLKTYLIIDWS